RESLLDCWAGLTSGVHFLQPSSVSAPSAGPLHVIRALVMRSPLISRWLPPTGECPSSADGSRRPESAPHQRIAPADRRAPLVTRWLPPTGERRWSGRHSSGPPARWRRCAPRAEERAHDA